MIPPILKEGERVDDLQIHGYHLIQDPKKFCFGMDAVLLSAFARVKKGGKVLDMGTGNGIIPILLAAKTEASQITGLEIQPEMAEMAGRSVRMNELENRINIVNGDIKEASRLFGAASFDAIVSNPPYITATKGLNNPSEAKAIARHEILCKLEDVIREASKCLVSGGSLFMIHRPHRLVEIFDTCRKYKMEPKRFRSIHSYENAEAKMVMVEAVRGGGSWIDVEAPLIIYREQGVYTEEIHRIYGEA